MHVVARMAAVMTLGAVLACSSLGTCWLYFAGDNHGCCAQDSALKAPPRPCGSAATGVASLEVGPPPPATLPAPVGTTSLLSGGGADSPFALPSPMRSPPLILRI
jgi:hypothetical protein